MKCLAIKVKVFFRNRNIIICFFNLKIILINNINNNFINMFRPIFNYVKRIVPRLSDTELLALRSGTVHTDRAIFDGSVVLPDHIPSHKLNQHPTQASTIC